MKNLSLIAVAFSLIVASFVHADDAAKSKAEFALSTVLLQSSSGCADCNDNVASHTLSYDEAYRLAMKTGKPFVVWIGKAACPDCIDATSNEFINWSAPSHPSFPDDSLTVGIRRGKEMQMIAQLKEWDGNHLPTIRRALRLWDSEQARGLPHRTLTDVDLWQTSTYSSPSMMYSSPPMMYSSPPMMYSSPPMMHRRGGLFRGRFSSGSC